MPNNDLGAALKNVLYFVTLFGTLLLAQLTKLVAPLPELTSPENIIVNWQNAIVLLAGLIAMLIHKQVALIDKPKLPLILLSAFVLILYLYQWTMREYTTTVPTGRSIVLRHVPVINKTVQEDSAYWAKMSDPEFSKLLKAYQYDSESIWGQRVKVVDFFIIVLFALLFGILSFVVLFLMTRPIP